MFNSLLIRLTIFHIIGPAIYYNNAKIPLKLYILIKRSIILDYQCCISSPWILTWALQGLFHLSLTALPVICSESEAFPLRSLSQHVSRLSHTPNTPESHVKITSSLLSIIYIMKLVCLLWKWHEETISLSNSSVQWLLLYKLVYFQVKLQPSVSRVILRFGVFCATQVHWSPW